MSELSDIELKKRLEAYDYHVPPITATTRRLLLKKLITLDEKNCKSDKEKMPNTLDDSEDFIADTPPAHFKKHQWRDITTEIDVEKESSASSPLYVNETDESDFENTPESSKENSKNVNDSDDSIIVRNKKKNPPVYVISSDSDEEPGDNANESDEIISSSANFASNVSNISYRNNRIIPEILDSDEESYSKSTNDSINCPINETDRAEMKTNGSLSPSIKGSKELLPDEAGESFIFNTSNKKDLSVENVKKTVFSPEGGDAISFEFINRDDSAKTIENCTNDLRIVTIESDESKDEFDESFHTPPNFKEPKSTKDKIPSPRELAGSNSNSTKYDSNSISKSNFEDDKHSLKKFDVNKKFTPTQVKDLESELNKLNRTIEEKRRLLQKTGMNLADKGAKLRNFIQDMQTKRDEKLSQLIHAKDNMTVDESVSDDNGSPILDKAVTNYKDSMASTIPLEHVSDEEQKLNTLHRKQRALQQQLSTISHRLNDGGETLRKEITNVNKEILALEPRVKMKNPNYMPPGKGIAMIPPQSNSAWQQFRSNISTAASHASDIAQRIWAQGPASDHLYGGRMNEARKIEVVTVTKEAIEKLKKCLETMPSEADEEEQPIGLRSSITLFPHQKQALSWLLWRECQDVAPGGILADDMGLGKTLTLLSLILKSRQVKEELETNAKQKEEWCSKSEQRIIRSHGTLLICPASLIGHWENEAKKKFKGGVFDVCMYHGANREQSVKKLARYDLVVTTYGTLTSEAKKIIANCDNVKMDSLKSVSLEEDTKNVELFSIGWERIILDEAHQIRNPRSKAAQAVCRLRGGKRWAVTGTPLQNKQLDMYSLLRFLRCYPFDEYRLWKSWVDNGTSMGQARLNTIVKSILLRRTKCQHSNVTGKAIVELPSKSTKEHSIKLTDSERKVYDKVFAFSQEAMMSYMRRYVDKDDSMSPRNKKNSHVSAGSNNGIPCDTFKYNPTANPSTIGAHKFGVDGDVKAHHLLILILRLRQICNHPSLIKGIIDEETKESVGLDVDSENDDLISKMTNMSLLGEKTQPDSSPEEIEKGLENVLTTNNPIFQDEKPSSKIKTVVEELEKLKESHRNDNSKHFQKAVIVSQWTSMLEVVKKHVKNIGLKIAEINGKVNVKIRSDIVDDFNRRDGGAQVMLLSLGAGGVGLNLVGANHLFLLDMHWNPQLEKQACDRIYRVGQTREVYIHKFLCEDTIERRILDLQEKKLALADGILTGAKRVNSSKLSLDDLKTLFSMGANEKATMPFTDDNL